MFLLFVKYFFIILCVFYAYHMIIFSHVPTHKYIFLCLTFIIILSLLCCNLSKQYIILQILFMSYSSFLVLTIGTKTYSSISFSTIVISAGLSFSCYIIATTLLCFLFIVIFKTSTAIPYTITYLLVGFTQLLTLFIIFKSNRIRNGINKIIKSNNIFITSTSSFFFVIYIVYITSHPTSTLFSRSLLLIVASLIAFLIPFYWRYRITQTYREKLRLANEKSLEDEIVSQKETIAHLEADNARLAQIVHKDNKIIHAMLTAVIDHLENTSNATPTEQISRGKELCAQLQDMAKERQGILQTQLAKTTTLPKSGLHTVDGMLSFMETRAKEAGITYKLHVEENMKELAGKSIEEADLLHLLGDLIDNTLIATKHANAEKEVSIHLGSLQGHFLLEISDSGIPFSLDTYQSLGNEPHTTHADEGGSGIGLMDIWKIKKKYKASLHICEYTDRESIYTKKLTFIFDRKNRFLLQTHRHKEAIQVITRGDLYIFPDKKTSFTD